MQNLAKYFNVQNAKGKALAFTLEHSPCCLLSVAGSALGIQVLNHNPHIELAFAIGGAVTGEYIGHRFFCAGHHRKIGQTIKSYGIALAFGLATWSIHQEVFHDHEQGETAHHRHDAQEDISSLRYNPFQNIDRSHKDHQHVLG